MRYLTCFLLGVFAALGGVTGEDCYKNCTNLLDMMSLVPSLSEAYCSTRKMLERCLEIRVAQCSNANLDTLSTILQQYASTVPCSDVNSTSTTFSLVPSSSVVTPQVTPTPDLDCTYDVCKTWALYFNTLENLTPEYCQAYKEFSTCVLGTFERCKENNNETFSVLIEQLNVKPTCPDIVTTTATTTITVNPTPTTASTVPSSNITTSQASDCYDTCQTLLNYLNTLEDLTPEYCQVYQEFVNCVGNTFDQCNGRNMETFNFLFEQLGNKPICSDTVASTAVVTTTTTVHPSPSSATPTFTFPLDCDFLYCGDLVGRLQELVPGNTDYCKYHREASACLDYTLEHCVVSNFLAHQFLKGIIDNYPKCNDTTPSPTSTISSSTSTTLSPTPTCINGLPIKVSFNDDLPEFLPPPEDVDNEHRCSDIFQQEKKIFYHCSFYTYSHLRAFRSTDLYTCSSPGLWALFNHPLLQVTVLNIVPDLRGPYTLADEVTIVIPESRCSQRKIYHVSASRNNLPNTFDDGMVDTNGLQLYVNSNKTSAYIKISWIDTTIAVHKLAGFVGVVILSPQHIADESVGLCSLGCPDHSKFLVEKVSSQGYSGDCEQEAIKACFSNGYELLELTTTQDSYFDRCVFDVLKSSNANSSWMTTVMEHNLKSLGPIGTPPSEPSTTIPWPIGLDFYQDNIDPEDYNDDSDNLDTDISPGLARPLVHDPQEQTSHSSSTVVASSSILLMVWCTLQWHVVHYILYT